MIVGVLKEKSVGKLLRYSVSWLFDSGHGRGLAVVPHTDSEHTDSVEIGGQSFALMSLELSQISCPVDDVHLVPRFAESVPRGFGRPERGGSVRYASGMRQGILTGFLKNHQIAFSSILNRLTRQFCRA